MTHGHELRGGLQEGMGGVPGGGEQEQKNWQHFNSIINKIYSKKKMAREIC